MVAIGATSAVLDLGISQFQNVVQEIYGRKVQQIVEKNLEAIKIQILKRVQDDRETDVLNRLYYTLVGSYIGLTTAKDEDVIKTYFAKKKTTVDGRNVS